MSILKEISTESTLHTFGSSWFYLTTKRTQQLIVELETINGAYGYLYFGETWKDTTKEIIGALRNGYPCLIMGLFIVANETFD